jgi:hypothetical protein
MFDLKIFIARVSLDVNIYLQIYEKMLKIHQNFNNIIIRLLTRISGSKLFCKGELSEILCINPI